MVLFDIPYIAEDMWDLILIHVPLLIIPIISMMKFFECLYLAFLDVFHDFSYLASNLQKSKLFAKGYITWKWQSQDPTQAIWFHYSMLLIALDVYKLYWDVACSSFTQYTHAFWEHAKYSVGRNKLDSCHHTPLAIMEISFIVQAQKWKWWTVDCIM